MAGKKVLIVYAHQEPRSFNGSLKKVAVEELSKQGCAITVSDLYAMDFEPRATRKDVIDRDLHLPVVIKTEEVMCGAQHLIGALSNPKFFNYGVEAYEAFKKRSLASDITDEQKKVQEADLVIFQFPLYWFSVPAILKGWMDRVLCQGFAFDIPGFYDSGFLKHGALHFCGFKVLAPQISFAPEIASEEERKAMVASWAQRLKTIWEEEPIDCTPAWYFGH
ncbi:ribosyldihydronicotinamide dehydrogenase [quinone] isoform X4 [Ailuropoda melanoleuca]|uniref:ribosyldihydronicotinamide dehydrogenase [quinone] isoform X4 n=1 Tax=Ailuropoda melanoleuca TaxID=9646 RepID=UPI001494EAE0|nr:ribosyldihydronicotinamide dehydrogenase [quinone] isoform X4 [Ailuropoda melanoleuca]